MTLNKVYLSSKAPKVFLYADDQTEYIFFLNTVVDIENSGVYVVISCRNDVLYLMFTHSFLMCPFIPVACIT